MPKNLSISGLQPKQRARHIPQRTCISCRRTEAKRQLIRLVRTSDQRVLIDETGKKNGRGAYLCNDPACWRAALKRRGLKRALRLEQLHTEDQERLEQFVQHLEDTMAGS